VSQQINLFNPIFLKPEKYLSARTMLQALGLLIVGLGSFYAFAMYETNALEDLVGAQRTELARERARLTRASAAASSDLLAAEAKRLEAEVKARRGLLETLSTGSLGNSEGIARYFAALGRAAVPGVWLTGFTLGAGASELKIHGRVLRAELVPVYLKALNAQPAMRGRQVLELKLSAQEAAPARAGAAPAPGPQRYLAFTLALPLGAAPEAKAR